MALLGLALRERRAAMKAKVTLSDRDLCALASIADCFVDADYWEDETIRLYRSMGLVCSDGTQIHLTEAGRQALDRWNLLPAAETRHR